MSRLQICQSLELWWTARIWARLFGFWVFTLVTTTGFSQAPGVVIEEPMSRDENTALLEKALALQKTGKLTPGAQLKEQLKNPRPILVRTMPPRTDNLDPALLARRARDIRLWIMVLYICPKCTNWHLDDFAAAYAVASDVIATCEHSFDKVVKRQPREPLRESYLLVRDGQRRLFGITSIVAVNPTMDAALLQVDPPHLNPVPLNDQLSPGDNVFCYSDPLGQAGYFSDGIVNRFYWLPNRRGSPGSLEQTSYLRVNFGTDWAPGSSGAPILDRCGNVAGHVSSIHALSRPQEYRPTMEEKTNQSGSLPSVPPNLPLITVHEGIPARGVLALIRDVNEKAEPRLARPPSLSYDSPVRPRNEEGTSGAP